MCTPTAERLASLNIVVDRLHFRGHVNAWCHQNCDPHLFDDLKDVSIPEHEEGHFSKPVFTFTCESTKGWWIFIVV